MMSLHTSILREINIILKTFLYSIYGVWKCLSVRSEPRCVRSEPRCVRSEPRCVRSEPRWAVTNFYLKVDIINEY